MITDQQENIRILVCLEAYYQVMILIEQQVEINVLDVLKLKAAVERQEKYDLLARLQETFNTYSRIINQSLITN